MDIIKSNIMTSLALKNKKLDSTPVKPYVELEDEYAKKSTLEIAKEVGGFKGTVGAGILKGDEVAKLQILYNKLIEDGSIKGKEIAVTGKYDKATGDAIFKIRELVGTTYDDEDRKKLKNRNIEKTLDGRTTSLLIEKLEKEETKKEGLVEKIEELERRADILKSRLDLLEVIVTGDQQKDVSKEIENLTEKIAKLKEEVNTKGYAVIEKEFKELRKELNELEIMVDALDAIETVRGAEKTYGNQSYYKIVGYFERLGKYKLEEMEIILTQAIENEVNKGDNGDKKLLQEMKTVLEIVKSAIRTQPLVKKIADSSGEEELK